MNCMKCGVSIDDGQVFCDHCLSVMEQYPIKPDAHIHLPKRATASEPAKKPTKKKRPPTPEEQILFLKTKVLRLRLMVAVLAFVLCLVSGFLALTLIQQDPSSVIGRNYTIDTSANK